MCPRHLCPIPRTTASRIQSWSIYPDMVSTWMLAASAPCPLWIIIRQYLIVDLRSIAILRLRLGLRAGTTVAARMRNRQGAGMNRRTGLQSGVTKRSSVSAPGPMVAAHCPAEDESFPTSLSEVVGVFHPDGQLCFIPNWAYWVEEADLEYLNHSGQCRRYMSGWHKVVVFALPPSARSDNKVWISESLKEYMECSHVLTVATPSYFVYYSHFVLRDHTAAPTIWHIDITEY